MAKTKEQMQIMILAAIVGCGVLFAVVYFGLLPVLESYKKSKATIVDLEQQLDSARSFTQKGSEFRAQYKESLDVIHDYMACIPKPVLGNYLLDMEESLEKCLQGLDIESEGFGDNGVIEIAPDSLFRLYTVRFNGFTSTVELIKLLENIAAMNPVVSITEISIMPVEKSPEKHRASFVVAWLIWKDPFNLPDYITKPPLLDAEEEALEKPSQET